MSAPIWKIVINKGILRVVDDRFRSWIGARKDGDYELIIRRPKKFRSDDQNRYLWVVYELIGDRLGWSKDEVHSHCASLFLREPCGSGPDRICSTKDLSVMEFTKYLENIKRYAAQGFPDPITGECWPELHLYIPDPNEVLI